MRLSSRLIDCLNAKVTSARLTALAVSFVFYAAVFVEFAAAADGEEIALPDWVDEFDSYIQENVAAKVPGAALAVVVDGKVSLLKSYGVRALGSEDPVTSGTVFRLGSVSKSLAATAAALLVEQKRFNWDTPVLSELDYVQFKNSEYGSQITLRNLLSHSSGFLPHAYTNLVEDNVPYTKIVKRLKELDFICPPGRCYAYQNVLYSLVGDMVSRVSGESYQDFVSQHIFAPLGMDRASFGQDAYLTNPDHAVPHIWTGTRWAPIEVQPNYYRIAPAAGANASIEDMAKWLSAQLGARQDVLSDAVLAQLHTKVIPTSTRQAHYRRRDGLSGVHYGLGWRVFDYGENQGFVHHGGWVAGSRAEVLFHPRLGVGLVLLTNAEARNLEDMLFKFLDLYQARTAESPKLGQKVSLQQSPSG